MISNRLSRYFLSIVLIILLTSCNNNQLQLISPHTGTIKQNFISLATTHLNHPIILAMPFTGHLTAELEFISLRPGDRVKKGQLVAQVTQQPLIFALKTAQANYKITTAQVATAKINLSDKSKEYAFQRKNSNRFNKLYLQKHISQQKHDSINRTELTASNALQHAKLRLKLLKSTQQVVHINLQKAQYRLRESHLHSPINGTILKVYHQGGSWVNTGSRIMMIGDLRNINISTFILSKHVHLINVGDKVQLGINRSSFTEHGSIERIYPLGETFRSPLGVSEQRVNVIILLARGHKIAASMGRRLYVKFIIKSQQTLIIPTSCVLRSKKGNYFVWTVVKNKLHRQVVTTGAEDSHSIAVLSGLRSKDKVVKHPTHQMKEGTMI